MPIQDKLRPESRKQHLKLYQSLSGNVDGIKRERERERDAKLQF